MARFRQPKAADANAAFLAALDSVNAAAEAGQGLVWRFTAALGHDEDRRIADDPHTLVNLSVWSGLEALRAFTYRDPLHRAMMRRRREWFDRMDVTLALWWVPAGARPSLRDGMDRLGHLARFGASPVAFTFAKPFDADGTAGLTDGPAMDSSHVIAAPVRPGMTQPETEPAP